MEVIIETERLLIREIAISDLEGMFEMDSSPIVHKYLPNDTVNVIDDSKTVINSIKKQYTENGIGRWAVVEKDSGDFIGWTGFKLITDVINNQTRYFDFGYRFLFRYWGNGYATESAKACLQYNDTKLKLKSLYAMANVDNNASKKVLLKSGFKLKGNFMHHGLLHNWFVFER